MLAVDDEPCTLHALRINLSARQDDVSTAVDGTIAPAAVARGRPDVTILDLGLPDTTAPRSSTACAAGRPDHRPARQGEDGHQAAALDEGVDDYELASWSATVP